MSGVLEGLYRTRKQRGGGFMLLLDPDRTSESTCLSLAETSAGCGVDALLVGSSFMLNTTFHHTVRAIKERTDLPVILFPGSAMQLTGDADAVLFTSLISSRNPGYLIEEQVKGAPLVKHFGLEAIPTGYMLIESGSQTSVQYMSDSQPIPRDKFDIACAHALAAQYMGMKLVYLEAGSGATGSVPAEMIEAVSGYVEIPVVTGGGIRTPAECSAKISAGASFVVVGNFFEHTNDAGLLQEMAAATHPHEPIHV